MQTFKIREAGPLPMRFLVESYYEAGCLFLKYDVPQLIFRRPLRPVIFPEYMRGICIS